ncbi:MAG: RsmE family RNA methyltransferase [bacterium]|nr:RsmE family RNA methyltransferase [bacterium]MDT8366405.1 RsmE family RNA methyltransferase [bacterium]
MSLHTFYIPPADIKGDTGTLTGDELRHARLTLRLGTGDAMKIVDGEGVSWNALVQSMEKEKGTLTLSDRKVEPIPSFRLTIAMGIVPGDRFDWAIQKGTELGASAFWPLITERTEVKIKGGWKRLPRLQRVVVSACKQCERSRFPVISEPLPLKELDTDLHDLSVVFWEEKTVRHLKEVTEGIDPPGSALMVIGPVGGLTVDEVELLKDKGFTVAGMGSRVLRTETAVTAGAALLQYLWGDM